MGKRRNYKVWHVILLAFVFLAASACGGNNSGKTPEDAQGANGGKEGNTSDAPSADEQTTLSVWWFPLWKGSDEKQDGWVKEKAKEFMNMHPNVTKIDIEMLDWNNGIQKLDAAIAAGSAPDLSYIDLAWLPKYLKQDMLVPIDSYIDKTDAADFYKSTTDYATYNGKLYAFPILIAPRVFYANKTMLEEMGLADKLPLQGDRAWTVDQFKEIAANFPYKKDSKTYYATQISTNQADWQHLLWFWNFGADLYNSDESKFTLNSPQGVQSLDFLLDMKKSGAFKFIAGGAKPLNFWAGDMAFFPDVAYTEEKVEELLEKSIPADKKIPEVVALQFPTGPDVAKAKTYSGIGGIPVFKQKGKNENHTKMAMEFAKYLTNTENVKAAEKIGSFPTRISSGDVFGGDENAKVARYMMQDGKDLGRGESTSKILISLINPELDAAFAGKKTSKQALDDLATKANEVLDGGK
ncbi:extracellular solute-binding protein [Paenibacillus sp. J2TS4]|uniref:extracellular solute-binding protein n=1 Tax=Paenibacillus sp. J2TS4 TaxID=2807194 RepID=UPI001B127200|nr:extracellular solute-binding protein [Paenibacillus sp. J2TS4]GIP34971.1 sugar ABC transporter substrate-binding protein [Paenibacillus sp. J2TS4]